jgi:hypothetical protein
VKQQAGLTQLAQSAARLAQSAKCLAQPWAVSRVNVCRLKCKVRQFSHLLGLSATKSEGSAADSQLGIDCKVKNEHSEPKKQAKEQNKEHHNVQDRPCGR